MRTRDFGVVAAVLWVAVIQSAGAATFVTLRQQNSLEDPGTKLTFIEGQILSGGESYPNALSYRLATDNPGLDFYLTLAAPHGQPLVIGRYDNARNGSQQGPADALLDFGRGSTRCSGGDPGYFIVREFEYPAGADGQMHIAIDYATSCGVHLYDRDPDRTMGSVRINSNVPEASFAPWTIADPDIYAEEGETINLFATRSTPGDAAFASAHYRQLSGTPVALAALPPNFARFTAPSVGLSGETLTFEVEVTNVLGLSSTDTIDVHVASLLGPRTFVEAHPGPGPGSNRVIDQPVHLDSYEGHSRDLIPDFRVINGVLAGAGLGVYGDYPSDGWSLGFSAPLGQPLTVGQYEFASDDPSTVQPGIQISGSSRGCNREQGRFVVLQADYDPATQSAAVAIDFEHYCDSNIGAAFGSLRINSTVPVVRASPDAAAGPDQNVEIGDTVTLNGEHSLPGDSDITRWQWTQISGAAVVITGVDQPQASFTAPQALVQGDSLVFELSVTNRSGHRQSDLVIIHVRGVGEPHDVLRVTGDRSDIITRGESFQYDNLQAVIGPPRAETRQVIRLPVDGQEDWDFDFAAPLGRDLEAGHYDNLAGHFLNATASQPGLSIVREFVGYCPVTPESSFTILELEYVPGTDEIARFAAEVDARCDQATGALHASIRYHSGIPVPFVGVMAAAGLDQRVDEREPVQLSSRGSQSSGNQPLTHQWRQISGTPVTLRDANTTTPRFDAPTVSANGESLEFEVRVSDASNLISTDRVRVEVRDRNRTRMLAILNSEVGEPLALGTDQVLDADRPAMNLEVIAPAGGDQLLLRFFDLARGAASWEVGVGSGTGHPLAIGSYNNAQLQTTSALGRPSLNVTTNSSGCAGTGRFDIRDLAFAPDGAVSLLVADFSQLCNGASQPLRGQIIYRAPLPDANAGADSSANEGATVPLSAAQSSSVGGSIASYSWRQISGTSVALQGANTASASFIAPRPSAGAANEKLSFEVTVVDQRGVPSTDVVDVTVAATPTPPGNGGGSNNGSGGGGATDYSLAAFVVLLLLRRRMRSGTRGQTFPGRLIRMRPTVCPTHVAEGSPQVDP